MDCLEETTFHDYLTRRLSSEAQNEVEGHLASCSSCVEVLSALPVSTPPDEKSPALARDSRRGALARFRVMEQVGHGGSGMVLVAHDPDLDRKVAIKVLHVQANTNDGATAQARLVREARSMARVTHRNVTSVYEAGIDEGEVFIVMEFVEGGNLRQWLSRVQPGWRQIVEMFVAAGRGLCAAHAAGVVHRDFKATNVLVGDDDRVLVTDFGLAAAGPIGSASEWDFEGADLTVRTLTRTGAVLGTPAYMAPEQILRQPLDPRADQFSFCVALHEALYGQRPFSGRTCKELFNNVLEQRVVPVAAQSKIPRKLRRILLRGMARDPCQRYAKLAQLLDDLESVLRARKRRLTVAIGVAVAVGLIALGVRSPASTTCTVSPELLAGVWDDERRQAVRSAFVATGANNAPETFASVSQSVDDYARAWLAMRTDACAATHERKEQSDTLLDRRMHCLERRRDALDAFVRLFTGALDPATMLRAPRAVESLPDIAGCADSARLLAAYPLPKSPSLRAQIDDMQKQYDDVSLLAKTGHFARALPEAEKLVSRAIAANYPPLEAKALYELAHLQDAVGQVTLVEDTLQRAATAAQRAKDDRLIAGIRVEMVRVVGKRQGRYDAVKPWVTIAEQALARLDDAALLEARLLNHLAMLRLKEAKLKEARILLERVMILREQKLPADHIQRGVASTQLGLVLLREHEFEAAAERYASALPAFEAKLGPDSAVVGKTLLNWGLALVGQGRYKKALERILRASAIVDKTVGPESDTAALAQRWLGITFRHLGDYERSRTHLTRALAIAERSLGAEHPDLADLLQELANTAVSEGALSQALAHERRALSIREKRFGPNSMAMASSFEGLAMIYLNQRKWKRALKLFRRGLAINEQHHGKNHPSSVQNFHNIATALTEGGDCRQAVTYYERALRIVEESLGPDHPLAAAALTGLGRCANRAGDSQHALPLLERALSIRHRRPGSPSELAATRFALAQTLWDTQGDRARALSLARQANATAVEMGASQSALRSKSARWLRSRTGPR